MRTHSPFSPTLVSLLIVLAIPFAVPHASAATGLVCIADPTVNPSSCPSSPATFSAPLNSNITVAVNIQGSDNVNGFDISTIVDHSVLQPVNIIVNNSIIHDPKLIAVSTTDSASGIARLAMVAEGYFISAPVTGNLFDIVYRVMASNRGTAIVFQIGCTGTSVPNTCVTVTNPNADSETVQNGSLAGPVTPSWAVSAPNGRFQTVSAGSSTFTNIFVNSLNGFSGTVNLNIPPNLTCPGCPTWSIVPTSVLLSSGSEASANFTFHTTTSTPPNSYVVSVNGTSASMPGQSSAVVLQFVVNGPPPAPNFTIGASPSNQNVPIGSKATATVSLASQNGFSGTVKLTTSPQPTCPNCPSWSASPTNVTLSSGGTGSSTLTFTSFSGGPTGIFEVAVNGTSGSLTHSTAANFTIVSPPPPQVGTVCIADSSTTTCPSRPVILQTTVGSQLQVAINIQNSAAFNSFDIQVVTNPSILRPVNNSLVGTVLPGPFFFLANTDNPTTGQARVAIASQGGITVAPTTGRLFSVIYNVVGSTQGSFILFPGGCTGTSNDSVCVTIANPNVPSGVDPENILDGNVTVSAPPDFSLSVLPSSITLPRGQSGSSTINVTSLNGFSGTVSLTATISPIVRKGPSVAVSPASVTLSPGGTANITLQVTTGRRTPVGTYTITITAKSATITKTTTVTLTIT